MVFEIITSEMDIPWYLVHCQSGKEIYTARALSDLLGIFVYCPQARVYIREAVQRVPFFPGYIFIQADLQRIPPSQIKTCQGVVRVVEFDGNLQPVPTYVIEEIFARLEYTEVFQHPQFHPGDVVRFKHQVALEELEMIFVGSMTPGQRVYVLLSILGRLKTVCVDVDMLEKVAACPNKEAEVSAQMRMRERYTRGKGRKIKRIC